ncbi:hypothetical protein GV64_02760 [Endozoicomonas elysicola]|uniref:Ankyrin n=2 Tax=Endozoicomonas elysicola TaxID=305900 RepID=A0A081K6M8_9GAMM|nr:hypothetical protein GV64_02760 [Endozoicomonas elysicola]
MDAGRGMLSSLLGYLYAPVDLVTRKVVCTEPITSFLLKGYVQKQQPENIKWMIDQGMTFDKLHEHVMPQCEPLVIKAVKGGDYDSLKMLVEHGAPFNGGSFWTGGELLRDAFNAKKNQSEIVEFLLDRSVFSAEKSVNLIDDPVAQEDVRSARQVALNDAINARCSDHILCLMLREVGASGVDRPEFTDEKCKSLYDKGLELELFEVSEDSGDSEDAKKILRIAVDKAHNKLEDTRLENRQF